MDDDAGLLLTLSVNISIEPIRGQLSAADGWSQHFVGWLGLTDAIATAICAARPEEIAATRDAGPPDRLTSARTSTRPGSG